LAVNTRPVLLADNLFRKLATFVGAHFLVASPLRIVRRSGAKEANLFSGVRKAGEASSLLAIRALRNILVVVTGVRAVFS
jgi:hypothetical protein